MTSKKELIQAFAAIRLAMDIIDDGYHHEAYFRLLQASNVLFDCFDEAHKEGIRKYYAEKEKQV